MSATLVHRGPDAEGSFAEGGVGLAARRLAIIDLEGGDQPLANEDGSCTVVQNGEIYNYAQLTRELERLGHRFRTHSDTETSVHAYEQWGLDFAQRLRGMFAVAIWDARERRLVLARDRFGIKPLYYRVAGGEISFASELDALPKGELDLDAVDAFLTFNSIPAPLSIFREIRKLAAGHLLTWREGEFELRRFARPGPLPPRHDADEAELVEECRARLRDSVRAHLVADAPVDVPRLEAGCRGRQGRALRRGRRRALRRLLHLRRRPARRARRRARVARTSARRAAPDLDEQAQLRLQGEAVHARGAPAAARAPSRLEGDLHSRGTRRADRQATNLGSVVAPPRT